MGCGGCARRREKFLRKTVVEPAETQPVSQPKTRCPACGTLHTDSEYAKCPFRLQLERQLARQAKLKAKLEDPAAASTVISRRGRQIQQPFSVTPIVPPSRKKW